MSFPRDAGRAERAQSNLNAMSEKEIVIMRIQNSQIAMQSGRSYHAEQEVSLITTRKHHGENGDVDQVIKMATGQKSSTVQLSGETSRFSVSNQPATEQRRTQKNKDHTKDPAVKLEALAAKSRADDWINSVDEALRKDPKIHMLEKCIELLEKITGRGGYGSNTLKRSMGRIELNISSAAARYRQTMASAAGQTNVPVLQTVANPNGYWTRQTVTSGFVKGEEHTAFESTGTVVTKDGRTLDFGISLEMSRSFERSFLDASKEVVYTDPLVINLDTDAASLSDVSFYFDLDGDGKEDELKTLNPGSGFLALDKNGDGKINDGTELFGTQSGDGFADLAAYDKDGNGWIDEDDDVYSKLRVWVKNGEGDEQLLDLKQANVGAIFLGHASTQFGLDGSDGKEQGVIRSTGLYLKETGEAGTVQHMDYTA